MTKSEIMFYDQQKAFYGERFIFLDNKSLRDFEEFVVGKELSKALINLYDDLHTLRNDDPAKLQSEAAFDFWIAELLWLQNGAILDWFTSRIDTLEYLSPDFLEFLFFCQFSKEVKDVCCTPRFLLGGEIKMLAHDFEKTQCITESSLTSIDKDDIYIRS